MNRRKIKLKIYKLIQINENIQIKFKVLKELKKNTKIYNKKHQIILFKKHFHFKIISLFENYQLE